jgi:hypothetical protein
MSMYCSIKTQFKNREALLAALRETGNWTAAQIEVHEQPQHLVGYQDDRREQTAHIIVRRQHVGHASNDLGFERQADGTYAAVISEYDGGSETSKYGPRWQRALKESYGYHVIKAQQEKRGRRVERIRTPQGRQQVIVTGYR